MLHTDGWSVVLHYLKCNAKWQRLNDSQHVSTWIQCYFCDFWMTFGCLVSPSWQLKRPWSLHITWQVLVPAGCHGDISFAPDSFVAKFHFSGPLKLQTFMTWKNRKFHIVSLNQWIANCTQLECAHTFLGHMFWWWTMGFWLSLELLHWSIFVKIFGDS